ncbi:MAG: hypothetical protein ACQESD_02105 [Thermoplasmatota archaeon]
MLCGCLFWLVIFLLIVAGLAYLLGADSLGELAIDLIRLIIIVLAILILLGILLVIFGFFDLGSITDVPIPTIIPPF